MKTKIILPLAAADMSPRILEKPRRRFTSTAMGLVLLLALVVTSYAATRTWTGLGANSFWTTAGNWNGGLTAPVNGDGLVFPNGVPRVGNTNSVSGPTNLLFLELSGSNYVIFSPPLNLTNGFTNMPPTLGSNRLHAPINVRANQTWLLTGTKSILTLVSSVSFSTFTLTVDGGNLEAEGNITGSTGSRLIKLGSGGVMTLKGPGNNVPDLEVRAGTLAVSGALSGGLSISNGAFLVGSGTVPPFTCAGTVRPGGAAGAGLMTVSPGSATFSTGSQFNVDLFGSVSPGSDYDQLRVATPPDLSGATLPMSLFYSPLVGESWVIITNTGASAFSTTLSGLAEGATFERVFSPPLRTNQLQITYAGGDGNDVVVTLIGYKFTGTTRTWSGAGTNSLWMNGPNWVGDVAPNQGDDLVFPAGAARANNTNDFPAGTTFNAITIRSNNYSLNGNSLRLNSGVHGAFASGSSTCNVPVTLAQAQSFTNSGAGALVFTAAIETDGNDLILQLDAGSMTFQGDGLVTGGGSLILRGSEPVFVHNAQPLLAVILNGGTLGGTGTVGTITSSTGGVVSPGISPGILTCGNLNWNSGTAFSVELNGPSPGSGYDRLIVNGTVDLNNAALTLSSTFEPATGALFNIIENDGSDPVTGTFAGLPEGAVLTNNAITFQVSYTGGEGNDVTLERVEILPEQFRAAWADIFHVGLTSAADVDTMVSSLVNGNYNAVVVQVLGYMDNATPSHGAHWKSNILPRSSRVTATFDPLAYLCQRAHANGIEVHAWLGGSGGGMYRVSTSWPPAGNTNLAAHPEWFMVPFASSEGNAAVPNGNNYLLDMGSPDVQEYLVSIVRELVTNYEIHGINWDDEIEAAQYTAGIGYPAFDAATYPNSGLARFRRNTGFIGTPDKTNAAWADYRRKFKNELIARCQAEIQSIKTNPRQPLRHSSSVMAYGGPPATCDFTPSFAYTFYSDWAGMLQNGWLDTVIPMNYKSEVSNPSLYRNWCDRAFSCWRYDRHIFMGIGAYLNTKPGVVAQLEYAFNTGFNGAVTYSYGVPSNDGGDWWSYAVSNIYPTAATVPTMPWRRSATATTGSLWGRVQDASTSNFVDDATVIVEGRPPVRTDGNGYYVVTMIPATAGGTFYSVTASKAGAISPTVSNVLVLAGDIVRQDLFLNVPQPRLAIELVSASAVRLHWTTNATAGFQLECNTNLNTTNWVLASPPPTLAGNRLVVTNTIPPTEKFYRLRKP